MKRPQASEHTATGHRTGTATRGATITRVASEQTGMTRRWVAGRRAWSRVTGVVGPAAREVVATVTPAGGVVVAAALLGLGAGLAWGWVEAWAVGVAATVLGLLAAPFLWGRHDYDVSLEFDRDRVVAGSEVTAQLHVRNDGRNVALPVVMDIPVGDGLVESNIPLLRPGAEYRETITIALPTRSVISVGPLMIARGDPLGILRREQTWPGTQTIYVHPKTVRIPSASAGVMRDLEGAVTTRIVDADLTFHAVRDYVAGDSRRQIHWKSTAKTGKLMVRQFEETRRSRIAVVLDLGLAEYADADEFEMGVSVAASLGLEAIRGGREALVAVSGEVPEYASGTVHTLMTLPSVSPRAFLDSVSALNGSERVMSIEAAATMTARETSELSMVVLVTGSQVSMPRLRKASIAFGADVKVVAMRCDSGAEPRSQRARELSVMTVGLLDDLGHLLVRAEV